MIRPAVLVAEPEPEQALSVRKLVLETAKFNVLTAHSTEEAMEMAGLFPNISGAILVHDTHIDCEAIAGRLSRQSKKVPIVAVVPQLTHRCRGADHHVPSHEPEKLLEVMRSLLGDPRIVDGATRSGAEPKTTTGAEPRGNPEERRRKKRD